MFVSSGNANADCGGNMIVSGSRRSLVLSLLNASIQMSRVYLRQLL